MMNLNIFFIIVAVNFGFLTVGQTLIYMCMHASTVRKIREYIDYDNESTKWVLKNRKNRKVMLDYLASADIDTQGLITSIVHCRAPWFGKKRKIWFMRQANLFPLLIENKRLLELLGELGIVDYKVFADAALKGL